ncbi:choline kinase family protein [Parvibaculum sp.]|uniref:choline kinase family protein n=1 Tax=Parvibaculum sp. TaxID=2024848 RepID=UPI0025EBEBE4|nr:choline kinase family protein [Parvibaculum sp.]
MAGDRTSEARELARALDFWSGPVEPEPLTGGITNLNFRVCDGDAHFVVRIGEDIPVHQVLRFNELTANRAAFLAGIAPEVVHAAPGVIVTRFIQGETLTPERVRAPGFIERLVPVLQTCHRKVPQYLRGPVLTFWVFHVLRDYAARLREEASPHLSMLAGLMARAEKLEVAVGQIDLVFGHNDMLAANLLDDGTRIWMIDWEYAGFNSPLFDLANLASNNEFDDALERRLLSLYFDGPVGDDLWRRYSAMKVASLLRETMWSMVSELHSKVDFDYSAYTAENLQRFERAYQDFRNL